MVFVYSNIQFPLKGDIRVQLSRIFGLGLARATYLCDIIGLSRGCTIDMLNKYQFAVLVCVIKKFYGTDILLRRARYNRLNFFCSLNTYSSMRYKAGLPIHGQTTRTNAKTAKSKFKARGLINNS